MERIGNTGRHAFTLLQVACLAVLWFVKSSAIGTLVALYHVLLQAGIVPESAAPCSQGVSCADIDFQLFGFASIPVLSLIAFGAVTALLFTLQRRSSR